MFLAGTSAHLSLRRNGEVKSLAHFLLTRGLWLMFLEVFVISPLGWSFSLSFRFTRLQVIWVIGLSMVVLSGLILILSSRAIGYLGLLMIFTSNAFDGARSVWLGHFAGAWKILHQVNFVAILPQKVVGSLYPLIPWLGVMMVGYSAGEIFALESARRRRVLLWLGGCLTLLFFGLRFSNLYGDPGPWSVQGSPIYTVMSFLRCNKYPPSLLYLAMTLGPACLVLAMLDKASGGVWDRVRTFGRVPLFYYLLHLPLLHAIAIAFSLVSFGQASWMWQDFLALRQSAHPLPVHYGYGLSVVYAVWATSVLLLYPACRWYAEFKQGRNSFILRYL